MNIKETLKKLFHQGPPKIILSILPNRETTDLFFYEAPENLTQTNRGYYNIENLRDFFKQRQGIIVIATALGDLEKRIAKHFQNPEAEGAVLLPFLLYKRYDIGIKPFHFQTLEAVQAEIQKIKKTETRLGTTGKAHNYDPLVMGCEIRYRYIPQEKLDAKRVHVRITYPEFSQTS